MSRLNLGQEDRYTRIKRAIKEYKEAAYHTPERVEKGYNPGYWKCIDYLKFLGETDRIHQVFREMADEWEENTGHISITYFALQVEPGPQMLGLGEFIVPFVLIRIKEQYDAHGCADPAWILMIKTLTKSSTSYKPRSIKNEDGEVIMEAWNMASATKSWIEWGYANGYIKDTAQQTEVN